MQAAKGIIWFPPSVLLCGISAAVQYFRTNGMKLVLSHSLWLRQMCGSICKNTWNFRSLHCEALHSTSGRQTLLFGAQRMPNSSLALFLAHGSK